MRRHPTGKDQGLSIPESGRHKKSGPGNRVSEGRLQSAVAVLAGFPAADMGYII
jgi:hypothetical protein